MSTLFAKTSLSETYVHYGMNQNLPLTRGLMVFYPETALAFLSSFSPPCVMKLHHCLNYRNDP